MQEHQFNLDFNTAKFKSLIEQISEDNPCGQDIRRQEIFIRLKDIRNNVLNNNKLDDIWVKKNQTSESWFDVIGLCETILTEYSKDLQVICYYIEAKVNVAGFLGLAESLWLFKFACDKYWDTIFPQWDNDNFELRLVPFKWINTHLLVLVKNISFGTNKIIASMNSPDSTSWGEYLQALRTNNTEQQAVFEAVLQKQDAQYFSELFQALELVISILVDIDEVYLAKFLDNGSSVSFVELIDLCNEILLFLQENCGNNAKPVNQEDQEEIVYQNAQDDTIRGTSSFMKQSSKSINPSNFTSVEEAYQLISQANKYLLKHDFHSPSPYLIRRALEWRKKSLYEVFVDLFSTTSNPQEIFTLLGLTHFDEKEVD